MPRRASELTKKLLDELRRRAEADPKYTAFRADSRQPGLGVRARRGKLTFVFTYVPPTGGARRRMKIDDYGAITLTQARQIARTRRAEVATDLDPQVERARARREGRTVEDAIGGYLSDYEARVESGARRGKRSGYASAQRRLERNVVPHFGDVRLRDLTFEQVERWHRGMSGTPVEANRTLAAFCAVFGWAERKRWIDPGFNPTRYVEPYEETGQRRALEEVELRALGEVLATASSERQEHTSVIRAILILALTGMRRAELLGHTMKNRRGPREGLRWSDIDFENGRVTLQTKTGRQVRVVGRVVVDVLRAAQPDDGGGESCVCPGTRPGQPFVGIDKARRRLWKGAGLAGVDLHSLRHAFASVGAHVEGGRYVGMVSPLLGHGHQGRSITERYITQNPDALRPAADAISNEIARYLGLRVEGKGLVWRSVLAAPAGVRS